VSLWQPLVEATAEVLATVPGLAGRVFKSRTRPTAPDELPVAIVFARAAAFRPDGAANVGAPRFIGDPRLVVGVRLAGASAEAAEAAADAFTLQILDALMGSAAWLSQVEAVLGIDETREVPVRRDEDRADQHLVDLVLQITVRAGRYDFGVPDTALPDFDALRARVTSLPAPAGAEPDPVTGQPGFGVSLDV
jgi:hypothetical protein